MFVLGRVDGLPQLELKTSKWCYPEGRVLRHHPKLNTYTLTLDKVPGSPPTSHRCDVEELRRLIGSHQKEDRLKHCEPALLVPNRDLSKSIETDECLPASPLESKHKEPCFEQDETCEALLNSPTLEDDLCCHQNGMGDGVQSQDREVEPDLPAVGSTGELSDKADCSQQLVEGNFSAPSCGKQREEADIGLCTISAKQGWASLPDKGNQEQQEACQSSSVAKEEYNTKSGNLESQDMGHAQSQDLLPTETGQLSQTEEESKRSADVSCRWDLPEEREGETSCNQETGFCSMELSSQDLEKNGQNSEAEPGYATKCLVGTAKSAYVLVNSEISSSLPKDGSAICDAVDEAHSLLDTETGNLSKNTKGNCESLSGLNVNETIAKENSGFSISEDSLEIQTNMVPGPVDNVGPSAVSETPSLEGAVVDPSNEGSEEQPNVETQFSETTSDCPDIPLANIDVTAVGMDFSSEVLLYQFEGATPRGCKDDFSNERIPISRELIEECEAVEHVVSELDDKLKA
ncbi:hypothetical protein DNTS_013076, partial [Danionella cerebrum]